MKESIALALIGAVTVIAVAGIAVTSGSMVRSNGDYPGYYGPGDGMMGGGMGPGMMDGYEGQYGNWSDNYSYMHMPAGYCWNNTSSGNDTWGYNDSYPWHMPGYCGWNQTWEGNYSYPPWCLAYTGYNETAPAQEPQQTQVSYQEPRHGCH